MPNGWIITLAALAPNLLWMLIPPPQIAPAKRAPDKFTREMSVIEWIGRVAIFVIPLFYPIKVSSALEQISALVMLCSLALYYIGWARYFINGRDFRFLYEDLFKIPLPLAICPIIYFGAASFVLHSIILAFAVVVFGVAHLYISQQDAQQHGF